MASAQKIETDVQAIFGASWSSRDGQVVPKTEDVVLKNGAVKLKAVFLYADMVHSTQLVRKTSDSVAAKVVRAYLSSMTQLITSAQGQVRSFDGDRVMGVFIGDSKNSQAGKCALQMNYVATKILRPAVQNKFPNLTAKGFKLDHCAGVASGEVLAVRGGVRNNNDLVFIGSAPNIAAKLSDVRGVYATYITADVYKMLRKDVKLTNEKDMWTSSSQQLAGETWGAYGSNWTWKP